MLKDKSRLTTEKRNARSRDIDRRSTLQVVEIINAEDRKVAPAVAKERKEIAAAVDLIVERLRHGVNEDQVGMALLVNHSFPDEIELAPSAPAPETPSSGLEGTPQDARSDHRPQWLHRYRPLPPSVFGSPAPAFVR